MRRRRSEIVAITLAGMCLLSCLISCTEGNQDGQYVKEQYTINPDACTEGLSKSQYTVDSICSLNIPDDIIMMGAYKISVADGRIYIYDRFISKKLYIFDHKGALQKIIGERGRARGEFIGQPDGFFVDADNKLHVLDKIGHKIIIYKEDGAVDNVVETTDYNLETFGLTGNGKYLMYFPNASGYVIDKETKEKPSSLLILDKECKNHESLMPAKYDLRSVFPDFNFFQDGDRLSFVPCFSDSVIVFKNDMIEKVVRFDFGGRSLCKKMPEWLEKNEEHSFAELENTDLVQGIYRYQETDALIYLNFVNKSSIITWLHDKRNGRTIQVRGITIFDGISPYTYLMFDGNRVIAYIDNELLDILKRKYQDKKFQMDLDNSPEYIKDLLEGRIKVPALVYITLK